MTEPAAPHPKLDELIAVLERLRKQSIELAAGTPDQLSQHMKAEQARYGGLIKAIGLKLD